MSDNEVKVSDTFLVCQMFDAHPEALRTYTTLAGAQAFVQRRAGVPRWKVHDSHGRSWESVDGDGKYVIIEVEVFKAREVTAALQQAVDEVEATKP